MQLDESLDFLMIDNLETLTVQASQKSGKPYMSDTLVDMVLRRPIRRAEKSPSGGVYIGAECTFHVPAFAWKADAMGGPPKAADLFIDADKAEWTVLRVIGEGRDGTGAYQSWRCDCVDLAIAHLLQDLVTVEVSTEALDASGVPVKGWRELVTRLPARVQPLDDAPKEERGILGTERRFDVFLSRELDLGVTEAKVVWPKVLGGYLDVTGYRGRQSIQELPVLECVAKV